MSIGAGFSSKTVWKKEATQSSYGTVIECGAGDQMPLITEGLSREMIKEPDNVIRYKAGHGPSDLTGKGAAGPGTFEGVYKGIESLIVSAMGFSNYSASPETIAAGVYKHTFEVANNLHTQSWAAGDGILAGSGYEAGDNKVRRGTLCIDKSVSIWEFASVMVNAMTIRGNSKGVQLEFDLIPRELDRASATNTSSSSWSIPDDDWISIIFQDLVLWIDDYSAGTALTSADAIGVSEVEIKLENNLRVVRDSQSGLLIAEPRREAKRVVTGSFTVPRYESDDFLDKLDAQSAMMAMLKFTGSQIGSTGYYRTFWIWLPTIKFDAIDPTIGGPGLIPMPHTFSAEIPDAVPAGFPSQADKEMVVQMQNDLSTNPLI